MTIDGIRFVIDCGFVKVSERDSQIRIILHLLLKSLDSDI